MRSLRRPHEVAHENAPVRSDPTGRSALRGRLRRCSLCICHARPFMNDRVPDPLQPAAPRRVARIRDATVNLAHGSGGRAMRDLIEDVFVSTFNNPTLAALEDQAVFALADLATHGDRLAFTTDSYVVDPLFFPGGDIGTLAVAGTVNDLAMCGARPLFLSCGMVLEEGLDVDILRRVAASMKRVADRAGVAIVTGDTKVVERG